MKTNQFTVKGKTYTYVPLAQLAEKGYQNISKLPFSIKVLLEAVLRQVDGKEVTNDHVDQLANWTQYRDNRNEIGFKPGRIVLQDFTGVPAVVDLAAMRNAVEKLGKDSKVINPLIPVDLVIDHSVMIDAFGHGQALAQNMDLEFERNQERYEFLRWAQEAFENFRVVPPATGIVHQVNLEYLASVVMTKQQGDETIVYPDSLVGTDSHTTMINGLGVAGWGVGGIEAEAGMLGQPLYFVTPEVVGVKLTGSLPEGSTATDIALTVTHMLRKKGVVGKFVEFFGPALSSMSLADRATVANMAPEYGATMGFFPVDAETLRYMRLTGRDEDQIALTEAYYKAQGMFRTDDMEDPIYSDTLELDLSTIVPTLAGPKRPQDKIALSDMKQSYQDALGRPVKENGFGLSEADQKKEVVLSHPNGATSTLKQGSVAIAAITSCTNTSNPSVMVAAGLVAKKAVEKGLTVAPYVKTSMAPGSQVVTSYLENAGLMTYLEKLGFHVAGYGCTTCIGNSGPLPAEVEKAIEQENLTVASVLSGNRNFEGRVHPLVKANYLASPPLVVAYALAGTVDIDLTKEPIGTDAKGQPVYFSELFPTQKEINETVEFSLTPALFREKYQNVFTGNQRWNEISVSNNPSYQWDNSSTYIQHPPFFNDLRDELSSIAPIHGARALAFLGDSVTTDHISPAGNIAPSSPAGQFLIGKGVERRDFNSYGSRRGNDLVMTRGTFANIRIRNLLAPGTEGGVTTYLPTGEVTSIYEAAMKYKETNTPLVILAGKEYGTGSSRDWAAKGTFLLGVKAVIAESFERIHRSNLAGMGVLPLQFTNGDTAQTLGLDGTETFDFTGLSDNIQPGETIQVLARKQDGSAVSFDAIVRLDSSVDIEYYQHGGILQRVLRQLTK